MVWSLDEDWEHDWQYCVAMSDGPQAIRWLDFEDVAGSYAVRMKPQQNLG